MMYNVRAMMNMLAPYCYDNASRQTGMAELPASVILVNRPTLQPSNLPTSRSYLNVREPDGSLVSREKYQGDTRIASRTYHFDGLGSTIALTDETGAVTDTYKYDAWGNATHLTGSTADNPYQYVGQLGYYTHYQEPTFGLLQLGVRYYDPTVGRFTQVDPFGGGARSAYAYSDDQPTLLSDPSGKQAAVFVELVKLSHQMVTQIGPAMACSCVRCAEKARGVADGALARYVTGLWDKKDPKNPAPYNPRARVEHHRDVQNGIAHCVSACFIKRRCGGHCATGYLTAREAYIPFYPNRTWDSIMDLTNNDAGFDVAAAGGSCVKGCIDKFRNHQLMVLDMVTGR